MMKIDKIIGLFLALFFFMNSYSMDSDEIDMIDIFAENRSEPIEQKKDTFKVVKGESCENLQTNELTDFYEDDKELTEDNVIDQQTNKIIAFITDEDIIKRKEEVRKFANQINYPSSYIEKDLIEPEIKRIDLVNLMVNLHALPRELIELILMFTMLSVFKDLIDLKNSGDIDFAACSNKVFIKPIQQWRSRRPYSKMFSIVDAFPLKNICRKFMESKSFKRNLSNYIKNILIDLFSSNDYQASNFLNAVVHSNDLSQCKDQRDKLDILLFARCLAEAGMHPNQECYRIKNGKRQKIPVREISKPFSLLEFAFYIGDYPLTKLLIKEKGGDISKISKGFDYLTNIYKNDFYQMNKLMVKLQLKPDPIMLHTALKEAIKNKSRKILADLVWSSIKLNRIAHMKFFIDCGLDVNQANLHVLKILDDEPYYITQEETPVDACIALGNYEFAKKLIEEWGAEDVHSAAENNLIDFLELLENKDINLDLPDSEFGETPLMRAVENMAYDCVHFLVEHGSNVNARSRFWNLPVIFYCFQNEHCKSFTSENKEIVRYLIEKDASAFEIINGGDFDGCNLLHFTILYNKNLDAVKFLVEELGFDIYEPNKGGKTPLMLASQSSQCEKIKEYLDSKMNS